MKLPCQRFRRRWKKAIWQKWLVNEGDSVSPGDVIAEIETDKATMEVEAVDEGTIAKIFVDAGTEGVKVNQVIAVMAEDGEDVATAATAAAATTPAATPAPTPVEPPAMASAPSAPALSEAYKNKATPAAANGAARVFASPLARRIAEQNGIDLATISGSGPNGRIVKADVEGKSATMPAAASTSPAGTATASAAAQPRAEF